MTAQELIHEFNGKFSNLAEDWPRTYEVDAATYGNVCHTILLSRNALPINQILWVDIAIGPNHGIMFKNVELILKS